VEKIMKKQLVSFAIASILLAGTHNAYAGDQHTTDIKSKQYLGAGIGAVAGALVAGPVGFVAGGLLGNLAGKHDAKNSIVNEQYTTVAEQYTSTPNDSSAAQGADHTTADTVVVARAGEIESMTDDDLEQTSTLEDILVSELNMDIFFLSGSTTVEAFYQPRITAVAMFMHEMDGVDIHLDGYSDRRGDKDSNLALATRRLESVRTALTQAGIDGNRIHINAMGEQQFVSRPGDLEAYTFDRRVVIRFEKAVPASTNPVAAIDLAPAI
jgi:outer membrane protein OmpA-like peptidoglycan-associated protein